MLPQNWFYPHTSLTIAIRIHHLHQRLRYSRHRVVGHSRYSPYRSFARHITYCNTVSTHNNRIARSLMPHRCVTGDESDISSILFISAHFVRNLWGILDKKQNLHKSSKTLLRLFPSLVIIIDSFVPSKIHQIQYIEGGCSFKVRQQVRCRTKRHSPLVQIHHAKTLPFYTLTFPIHASFTWLVDFLLVWRTSKGNARCAHSPCFSALHSFDQLVWHLQIFHIIQCAHLDVLVRFISMLWTISIEWTEVWNQVLMCSKVMTHFFGYMPARAQSPIGGALKWRSRHAPMCSICALALCVCVIVLWALCVPCPTRAVSSPPQMTRAVRPILYF